MSETFAEPGRNGVSHAAVGNRSPHLLVTGADAAPKPVTGLLAESPSLLSASGDLPAYEMKFLIGADEVDRVETWAAAHMLPDAHADPALGNAYRTLSLYLDTPALDVYHRVKPYRRRKFRVRRYGAEAVVYLERKKRSGDEVSKRRAAVAEGELALLGGAGVDPDWAGEWFRQRVQAGGLRPVCLVGYERMAYMGASPEGPLRLTLDRGLHCLPACGWRLEDVRDGRPLLEGQAVLELKFRGAMPLPFKRLLEELRLAPAAASKYRLGVRAWGLDGGGRFDA